MNSDNKDKLIIDSNDSDDLSEAFSRKEVGDKMKFTIVATLDEFANKIGVLSLDKVVVLPYDPATDDADEEEDAKDGGADEAAEGENDEGDQGPTAAAVGKSAPIPPAIKMFAKGRKSVMSDDEG